MADRWRDIGTKAELTENELYTIEQDGRDSPEACLEMVINSWERKQPLTWAAVVSLLVAVEKKELAKQLAESRGWFSGDASGGAQGGLVTGLASQQYKATEIFRLVDKSCDENPHMRTLLVGF